MRLELLPPRTGFGQADVNFRAFRGTVEHADGGWAGGCWRAGGEQRSAWQLCGAAAWGAGVPGWSLAGVDPRTLLHTETPTQPYRLPGTVCYGTCHAMRRYSKKKGKEGELLTGEAGAGGEQEREQGATLLTAQRPRPPAPPLLAVVASSDTPLGPPTLQPPPPLAQAAARAAR